MSDCKNCGACANHVRCECCGACRNCGKPVAFAIPNTYPPYIPPYTVTWSGNVTNGQHTSYHVDATSSCSEEVAARLSRLMQR